MAKDPGRAAELDGVLYRCAEALRLLTHLLTPYMPASMAELAGRLDRRAASAGTRRRALPTAGQARRGRARRPTLTRGQGEPGFPFRNPSLGATWGRPENSSYGPGDPGLRAASGFLLFHPWGVSRGGRRSAGPVGVVSGVPGGQLLRQPDGVAGEARRRAADVGRPARHPVRDHAGRRPVADDAPPA